MRKLLVFLAIIALFVFSQAQVMALTSRIYINSVTNTYPTGNITDTIMIAGSSHIIEIWWDGTGATTAPVLTTNNWLIHGTADWGTINSTRAGLVLRQFVDNPPGTLNFGVGIQHMGWHKVGGSGDANFGFPGTATKEPASGSISAGPYGNNATGSDTVGILLGLTSTGPGWEPAVNPVGATLQIDFSTLVSDDGKTICIDSASQPLGSWEWAPIGEGSISPSWDNGLGNNNTRCWLVRDTTLLAVTNRNENTLPTSYKLGQNYPNPFNPTTVIEFDIPEKAHASIKIFNVLGQKVKTLVDQDFAPGSYEVDWDGTNDYSRQIASGIYFYRFSTDNMVKTKKMMLLK